MKKVRKIQLSLTFLGLLLFAITYLYYPNMDKDELLKDESFQKDLGEVSEDQMTILYNVEYLGRDVQTPFTLRAKTAEVRKAETTDLVYLDNLHLILHLKNGQVDVYAKKGTFNKLTNDIFMTGGTEEPIRAIETPGTTVIYADNINLLAGSSEAEIFNNVRIVDDKGSFLEAYSIKYDFLQKELKVSAKEYYERVKMKIVQ